MSLFTTVETLEGRGGCEQGVIKVVHMDDKASTSKIKIIKLRCPVVQDHMDLSAVRRHMSQQRQLSLRHFSNGGLQLPMSGQLSDRNSSLMNGGTLDRMILATG